MTRIRAIFAIVVLFALFIVPATITATSAQAKSVSCPTLGGIPAIVTSGGTLHCFNNSSPDPSSTTLTNVIGVNMGKYHDINMTYSTACSSEGCNGPFSWGDPFYYAYESFSFKAVVVWTEDVDLGVGCSCSR